MGQDGLCKISVDAVSPPIIGLHVKPHRGMLSHQDMLGRWTQAVGCPRHEGNKEGRTRCRYNNHKNVFLDIGFILNFSVVTDGKNILKRTFLEGILRIFY